MPMYAPQPTIDPTLAVVCRYSRLTRLTSASPRCWHVPGPTGGAVTMNSWKCGSAKPVAMIPRTWLPLHPRTALFAYASIFPPEAAPPELHHLTLDWEQRLGGRNAPNLRGFVAVSGDQISGVILAGADPDHLEMGHITRLHVDVPQWGQGIGTLLYETAVSHLKQAGYGQASLWVLEENARARAWYERLGWTPTGEHKVAEGTPGVDDVRYIRSL